MMNNNVNKGKVFKTVGIDSCKKTAKYQGWASFWIDSLENYGYCIYPNIREIISEHQDADCFLIDIPIGLPESEVEAKNRPDQQLRTRLVGRKSSVFNTPCRQSVYCQNNDAARAINLEFLRKDLSEQSLGFSKKIREVDEFVLENPQYIGRLRESHPEYAFSVLNQGRVIMSKKKEPCGVEERRFVLQKVFSHAEKALSEVILQYPRQLMDDFIDAMVLAVMARLGMQNGFETIPEYPIKDIRGLPMEIVYCKV